MLEVIYEEMSDKTLSFGCNVIHEDDLSIIARNKDNHWDFQVYNIKMEWISSECNECEIGNIIWHPVMIWDVLDYIDEKEWYLASDEYESIVHSFTYFRKPIEEQDIATIEFVYSLINDG